MATENNKLENELAEAESSFEIDLLNKVTGVNYPQAAVYGNNTLGQVLEEYATDIGVNPREQADRQIHERYHRDGRGPGAGSGRCSGDQRQCRRRVSKEGGVRICRNCF